MLLAKYVKFLRLKIKFKKYCVVKNVKNAKKILSKFNIIDGNVLIAEYCIPKLKIFLFAIYVLNITKKMNKYYLALVVKNAMYLVKNALINLNKAKFIVLNVIEFVNNARNVLKDQNKTVLIVMLAK